MNEESLTFTLTQINHLVSSLNKKNFSQNSRQIALLVKPFGLEADRHLLRCLFSSIDFNDANQTAKNSLQAKLLNQELNAILNKSSLITNICFAVDNCFPQQKTLKPTQHLFNQLFKSLNCSPILEVVISLALTHSRNPEFVRLAENHLKICLPALIQSYVELDTAHSNQEGSLSDISPELLQLILSLLSHDKYKKYGVSELTHKKFVSQFSRDFPRDRCPLILAPLIYSENTEISADKMSANSQGILTSAIMDTSWASLVMDIGYAFTASTEECKNHLTKISGRDLSAQDIAKIIGLMCKTHKNLSDLSINLPNPSSFWSSNNGNTQNTQESKDKNQNSTLTSSSEHTTWKPEVFVQAIKEVAPNTNWKDVCVGLDHAEFVIKDRAALVILISIIRLGMQSSGAGQNFPVECLYRHWTHPEGQLSLIQMILKNPDVYSIADNIYTSVPIELLKTPPETDNKEIGAWKSVHLVEVLLYIAENGFYAQALEHFKVPMQHCPDVLFMALLQISPPLTVLRQEIFQTLMPLFLGNHPNSGTILHHAWNATNFNHSLKHMIMHSMSEWYKRGENDQSRLTRILDVAQDLKALSSLLNVRSFQFVIDLACLASRREYLKLDKWLNDKIREHGESFVQSIVTFLQRRCPQIMGAKISEDQIPKAAQLPHETLATMMSCLQACVTNVQQELADIIVTMTTHCSILLKQRAQQQQTPQAPPPGVLRRGLESTFSSSGANPGMLTGPIFDTLPGLSSNLAGLNLSGPTNGAFNFNTTSPSRLLQGQSNSPFQLPIVPLSGLPPVNNLGRIAPTPTSDKLNMSINNQAMPDMTQKVSKEVEDEANGYFQRIYNHSPHPTLSIDEVLDMLQRFQESQVEREREVQRCMVRNLFEEYRFFPQYPDRELQITAQLFGGIVERGLVPSLNQLGLALRCVLDALRKSEGSKMYYFGVTALDRFKNKLHQYQNYCEYVKQIPHFKEFPAHLMEYVNYGTKALEPPNKPQSQALPMAQSLIASNTSVLYRSNSVTGNLATTPTTKSTPITNAAAIAPRNLKSIANATNINTLLVATADRDEKIQLPPDAIQDKTAFIFNNLSQINMTAKCEELKEIMTKEYWAWLSQYMVLKRASIELNFHALYSNFLDALKNPDVLRLVTKETFRNIRVLLRSDKGIENFSDRSLLKNLGHWLGMMTLGRNRPILHIDLDLKSLLVEAYHKGQQELLYVVPFVAKIIESCAKSKAFKPPNPWTMGIMNVLAELHQEQNLKLNLKFEIEVLCKTLSIDIVDLKPIVYLRDQERLNNIEYQLSQPNRNEEQHVQQLEPQQSQVQQVQQVQQQQQIQQQQQPSQPTTQQQQQSSTPQQMAVPSVDEQNIAQMSSVTNASPSQSGDPALPIGPPEPKYSYSDITVGSMSNLSQYIHYSQNIAIIHAHPQVKQLVRTAIERTISDWLTPVVERSVRIAVTTCEQILRKDFALDSDETRLRKAAHYMVRNLTAGMAMITCRDQLNTIIQSNIKSAFASSMLPPPAEINELATQIANDNVELACAFIQKTATEKAIPEIEKRLTQEFEVRKLARQEGRRHCDSSVLSYQNARMPEQIRLKVGGISNAQFSVYDEFARNIPGFKPMTETDAALLIQKVPLPIQESVMPVSQFNDLSTVAVSHTTTMFNTMFNNDEIGFQFEELGAKMEAFLNGAINVQALQVHVTSMHALLDCLMTARRSRDNSSTLNLLNKAVENIMEGIVPNSEHVELLKHYRDIHLRLLHLMQDSRAYGSAFTNRAITKCMIECREEIRYNIEAADLLISSNFVNISQFDYMLSQLMENGNNYMAIGFAMQLVQRYFVDDRPNAIISEQEFLNTIDFLVRSSTHPRAPEGLSHLVDLLRVANDPNTMLFDRSTTGPTQHIHSGITQARSNELNDPPGMAEGVEYLLKDWAQNYHAGSQSRDAMKSFSLFVNKLNLYGVLKTDELITRFFRHATQWCINLVYNHLNDSSGTQQQNKSKIFHYIDSFVRLMALIVKYSGDNPNATTKINLLNKILGIIVGVLLQDQEQRAALLQQQGGSFQQQDDTSFKQLGYHRLFIMLFLELSAPEPILENISLNVVTAFCHTYHILRPTIAPAFCYSWLELISHRVFIGRILALIPQQRGWAMYSQLLLDLFKYLAPFLRNAELAKPVQLLYKGTLRVLLVLLHDFPEFLCDYHFGFCDVIPSNCIQMRNLILAAFPRNMRLPDPFTPNLKVDMLTEITTAPRIFTNYVANIQPAIFKKDLDSYLKARAPVTFLSEMRGHLQISNTMGSKYNVPLMNALVLYVGTQAIAHIRSKNLVPNMTTIVHCSHMDIFQNLIVDLDHEGRYLFLNAVANQLRYPNSHTHYFGCTLLYLFAEANSEAIQEQITRVLLERLIVNRPHPWGLLITFIELIKNPIYKFWGHDFVHCAPEIEKLFESVARSCMVVKAAAAQQQSVEGELQECN